MKENVLERNARLDTERKIADFRVKQQMDYAFKVKYAKIRAWEFYDHPDVAGSCYVAVGGLDSITLLLFLRSIGIDVPAISVSSLEDKSIQLIHKQLGVKPLKPLKSKVEVLREYGWPVISKEVAGKISLLQNPSEKNATVRHAIITGETGAYGGFRTGTRMKLAQKWLEIFGGYENENEGVSYKTPDFLVSDKCCYYLKEKPCSDLCQRNRKLPVYGPDGVRRRAQAESVDDARVQLHIAGNETQLSIRDFLAAGSFAACAGFAGSGAGNLRRDRARRRRNTQDDKSTENRVLHVRVRRAHGKTPTPVRPAVGAESKGVGNVDESRNAG